MALYTIILSPDPDAGGFTAICPAMPGAVTEGESRNDTLRAIRSVIEVWLEVAEEDGYAPLVETAELIAQRIANVLEDRDQSGWDRTLQTCMVEVRAAVAA